MSVQENSTDGQDPIDGAMIRDRHRLRQLRRQDDPGRRAEFDALLSASIDVASQRQRRLPEVVFPQDLPILSRRDEIAETIRNHQVVILCGETGSGKSTQLPKICLEMGFGVFGMIGHTQPRRIAARSIANRVADELNSTLGQHVGYKIRFTDQTDERTYIKLMTDGILLAELQGDPYLNAYEVLIIDEAHERSLNIDFLLGFLKKVLRNRPELKVIITSATLDAERFAVHFGEKDQPAPIIQVSGRTYPVEVRYRPLVSDDVQIDAMEGLAAAIEEVAAIDSGHILVFLPTERDIREAAKHLRGKNWPLGVKTEVLPLYARLTAKEQNRVFERFQGRRIILSTNVAESSLTVPGIRYVVDTGTARISRYAARSKVQRLPIEPISRASADQRKGRCGRVADGVCIRLYSEEDFESRAAYTTPEIQRTNLAAVILRAAALRLGKIEDFPMIDPPRPEAIRDGYRTLFELGAIDDKQRLTQLGRKLSRFPVDPRVARVIVAAGEYGCVTEVLIIASALAIQDPRERPIEKQQAADEQHAKFTDDDSDFMVFLNIWDFYQQLKEDLSRNRLRKACIRNFLSYNRLREWTETHRQLRQLAKENQIKLNHRTDDYDGIHQSLLTGFLSGVAYRSADYEYTGAGGVKFHLWPGCCVFENRPSWALVTEILETRRRYGRTVGSIRPQWVEPIADHVLKRRYDEPHWHRKSGRVMAWETVTLFGMPVVHRRRKAYGPIQPLESHEIFLRDGLAKRDLDCGDKFYDQNEATITECEALASKTRKADFVVDEYTLYRFYADRLPTSVYDLKSLRAWIREDESHREAIRIKIEDLAPGPPANAEIQYPNQIEMGSMQLPLDYAFQPGDADDGVTITVPEAGLPQLDREFLDWCVPGMMVEKVIALIRSLPKSIRRSVIPAPDTAQELVPRLRFGEGSFLKQVAGLLSDKAGERIAIDAFKLDKLPAHLNVNIRVVGEDGGVKAEGRDVLALREELNVTANVDVVEDENPQWHRDNVSEWDFGDLPKTVRVTRGGIPMDVYPSIRDCGDGVQLRLMNCPQVANRASRAGIRRLYSIQVRKSLRSQVSWLPRFDELCVLGRALGSKDDWRQRASDLIADRAFFRPRAADTSGEFPTTTAEFENRLADAPQRIAGATQDVAKLLPKILDELHAAQLAIEECRAARFEYAVRDVQRQIDALTAPDFLVETPWHWLTCYPRFFAAIAMRLEKLKAGADRRDSDATAEIVEFWTRYESRFELATREAEFVQGIEQYRWMIEELRVSRFAQSLGTSVSVSEKRLEKLWSKIK